MSVGDSKESSHRTERGVLGRVGTVGGAVVPRLGVPRRGLGHPTW